MARYRSESCIKREMCKQIISFSGKESTPNLKVTCKSSFLRHELHRSSAATPRVYKTAQISSDRARAPCTHLRTPCTANSPASEQAGQRPACTEYQRKEARRSSASRRSSYHVRKRQEQNRSSRRGRGPRGGGGTQIRYAQHGLMSSATYLDYN